MAWTVNVFFKTRCAIHWQKIITAEVRQRMPVTYQNVLSTFLYCIYYLQEKILCIAYYKPFLICSENLPFGTSPNKYNFKTTIIQKLLEVFSHNVNACMQNHIAHNKTKFHKCFSCLQRLSRHTTSMWTQEKYYLYDRHANCHEGMLTA